MTKTQKLCYATSKNTLQHEMSSRDMPSKLALLCCSLFALPGLAFAEVWTVTPELNIRSGYDDNIRLSPEGTDNRSDNNKANGGVETNASVALEVARLTPVLELRGRARADFISYTQEKEEDVGGEDNQYIDASGRYKLTPINDIGIDFTLERKFTGTSDRSFFRGSADSSVREPSDELSRANTDIGVTRVQVRRERIQAEPYWSIGLSQNTRLRLQYLYDDAVYGSGADLARLVDFTRQRGSARLEHKLTGRSRVFFSVDGGTFEADTGREYDELAVRTGYRYNLSPISVVGFNVGARQISSDDLVTGENEDDTGTVVRIFGEHRGELTHYTASLGRTITPSGNGVLVESDIAEFNISRSLSPRFELRLESEYFGNSAVGSNSDPRSDRDHIRVSPLLRWNWTPEWAVSLAYEYEWEDREINGDLDAADSNGAFISIVYKKDNEIGQ